MNLDVEIPDGWQSSEHLKEENGERLAFDRLRCVRVQRGKRKREEGMKGEWGREEGGRWGGTKH